MFRWTSLSTLFVALSSYGITLQEAQEAFLANVALVPSGSITYKVEYHRPKDNLLGVVPGQEQVPDQERVPVIAGERDVALAGVGSFKWKDEMLVARISRVYLSTLPDRLLSTEIHEFVESWGSKVGKRYFERYSTSGNGLEGTADPSNKGELLERYGVVRAKPRMLNLVFLPMAYFCPSLRESHDFFPRMSSVSGTEEGLVKLEGGGPAFSATLDPTKGSMPLVVRHGGSTHTVAYTQIDGTWFPMESMGEWRDGEKLLYSIQCELVSHEFNIDYPDSDFDFQFPAGTPVEDEIQGTEYIAVAN